MRSLALLLVALGMVGCPHPVTTAFPDRSAPSEYAVAVAVASAERTVTAVYTLSITPVDEHLFSVRTLQTQGAWDEGKLSLAFDSEAPKVSDPWPLSMQHAIASVPATIRFTADGVPVGLEEPAVWKMAGQASLLALRLPEQASSTGDALLDPVGLVRDLKRSFPGTPPDEGGWEREEIIAGLTARRVESCSRTEVGRTVTWSCAGVIEGPTAGPARLHDGTSQTTLVVDRHGLLSMEGTYAGTIVMLDPELNEVVDRPVAGRRLVLRQ